MNFKRAIAGTALASILALAIPAAPALADGAASTRNIILGIGAASYLIIQHNRKVHEKYAEDARRQAQLQEENNNAWAAYSSEKNAYDNALAEVSDLKREVAYQHDIIVQQRSELAMAQRSGYIAHVAAAPQQPRRNKSSRRVRVAQHLSRAEQSTMVSYGWGSL